MKKLVIFSFIIFGMINIGFSILTDLTKSKSKDYPDNIRPNTVIIKFKGETVTEINTERPLENKFNKVLSSLGAKKLERIYPLHNPLPSNTKNVDLSRFYELNYTENINPFEAAKMLSSNPLIEYAEPKYIRFLCYTPNDLLFNSQWALPMIQAEKAWEISQGDTAIIIAIVDTGIDWGHPDLTANIWINKSEIANNGKDDDHNGYVDDIRGWDFGGNGDGDQPTPDNDPNEDGPNHGTHVAGIASAVTNNNLGISGIGFKCKLMAVKVSQKNRRGSYNLPLILYGFNGIVYAADNGAKIINCSWGGKGFSQYESDIIEYATQKGALVVAAAGNITANEPGFQKDFYPAAYKHVLSVAASDYYDYLSGFSFYGPYVDVAAPGVAILSTWFGGDYLVEDGSSAASPLVAGLAGLVKARFPNLTPDQIRQKIRVSCDKIDSLNPVYKDHMVFGRINAYKALTMESPALRMLSFSADDTTYGNGNGVYERGEKILLKMDFINYLNSTINLTVNLISTDPYVKINKGTFSVGKITTFQRFNNYSNPFEIEIGNNSPYDFLTSLKLIFSDENYYDPQQLMIELNPSFANSTASNIEMTVTSIGNLGFIDYPIDKQGTGFIFNHNGKNLLFEGALMMGTSSNQVSSAARGSNQNLPDRDFKILKPIGFSAGKELEELGTTVFNDDYSSNPLNVKVSLNTYSYQASPYNDFIILNYNISNNNSTPINNFFAGLFLDWDIGLNGTSDAAVYDHMNKIGYAYNVAGTPKTICGAVLLNNYDKENFYAILNDDHAHLQIYNGFTPAKKFETLSSGTIQDQTGPGDISFVIGNGPFNIPPGGAINVSFALIAGDTLANLLKAAESARNKFNADTISVPGQTSTPTDFYLFQNYPNPFNPSTTIRYSLKVDGNINLKIFDIKGSMVKEMTKQNQTAGEYNQLIDFSKSSTGLYFYKLSVTDNSNEILFSQTRRLIFLK